jgi:hypothetical protein
MSDQETRVRRRVVVELDVPQFRADTDQRGDWYVWRRMGASGWATLRRCESREHALRLSEELNGSHGMSTGS